MLHNVRYVGCFVLFGSRISTAFEGIQGLGSTNRMNGGAARGPQGDQEEGQLISSVSMIEKLANHTTWNLNRHSKQIRTYKLPRL